MGFLSSSSPLSAMQSISTYRHLYFRLHVCSKTDYIIANFLCKGNQEQPKTHLLSWELVTRPQAKGGLRIRQAHHCWQS